MKPCTIDIYLRTISILLHITRGKIERVNGRYVICDAETGLPLIADLGFLPQGFRALGYDADGETLDYILSSIVTGKIRML